MDRVDHPPRSLIGSVDLSCTAICIPIIRARRPELKLDTNVSRPHQYTRLPRLAIMDGEELRGALPSGLDPTHLDNAVRAIQTKKPIPTIDFTLHTMEDGSQVSTMERVCKGTVALSISVPRRPLVAPPPDV